MKPWLKKNNERVVDVEGCKITLKPISFGDSRSAVKEAFQIDPLTNKSSIDATLLGVLRAIAQIKDWDLTDENDQKLPVTLETFDNILDEEFAGKIIKEVSGAQPQGVNAQEKKK